MRVACLWFQKDIQIESLAQFCWQLSPQIAIRKNRALFIEIGKCANLYDELDFIRIIGRHLKDNDLQASIALGDSIFQALLKARFNSAEVDTLPLGALSDVADPFETDIILRKYAEKMILSFQDLGVLTVGQFKKVPAQELASRFGAVGSLCRTRLQPESQIAWTYWRPEEEIIERTDFQNATPNWDLEPILFELKKHLDTIFQKLVSRGSQLQKVAVTFFTEANSINQEPERSYEFDFLFPQGSAKGALNIIRQRIERDLQTRPFEHILESIEIRVLKISQGCERQKNLLHSREEVEEKTHSLINELQETHGRESVFKAQLTEDRRPEKSWSRQSALESPTLSPSAPLPSSPPDHLAARVPLRPLYLLKPVPVEVSASEIHVQGRSYKISKWSEFSEKISGGWGEAKIQENKSDKPGSNTFRPSVQDAIEMGYDRDYFQLEIEDGTQFTVFTTPEKKFYLQGYSG